ncbi:aldehyde dehydrogenase family protein [Candidatus Fermentibacteria bacterium]|nr:aldehyde dehydrogenase family protein [Candidatus Fermentibacteria bacterium]
MRANEILEKLGIHTDRSNPGAFVGGKGPIKTGGGELVSGNPSDGEDLAAVAQASSDDYAKVADAAYDSFRSWRMVPAPVRGEAVRLLGNALREMKEPLGDLISLEMGKIRAEGHGEVQEMIDICDLAVGMSRQLYGKSMHSERHRHRMYEQWHPLGSIGVITSFNFPMAVWAWNAAIAMVCGDTVIWKPSSRVPLCAIAVQKVADRIQSELGYSGVLNLVAGSGSMVGQSMLEDERVPLVSFTGSCRMGRRVSETVAARFGRTILELGGNNAAVVAPSADPELAADSILFAAVGTAGQRCTTNRRLIVHSEVAEELVSTLVGKYESVAIGDPLDDSTLMGPLVTVDAVEEMKNALDWAKKDGGELLTGGEVLEDLGPRFVTPAIVRMPEQTEIVRRETFAPILYVMEYSNIEEAIRIHNDVPQGLSSCLFSRDLIEVETFLSHMGSDCGIANVNTGTSGAEIGGAFGGEKETGGGRESGSDAWKGYMRRQTCTINFSGGMELAQGIDFG